MIKGKTKSGFKFEVDERALNDWNFTRLLSAISRYEAKNKEFAETEDKQSIAEEALRNSEDYKDTVEKLFSLLLRSAGKDKAFDFIAENNDGYILASDVGTLLREILTEITRINSETKKSAPSPTS